MRNILLASGSPRRAFLLDQLDLTYRVVKPQVEEIFPDDMPVSSVAEYLATLKGNACLDLLNPDEILLAADTIVVLDGRIIGKPRDKSHACDLITSLSGRKHMVTTGVFMTYRDTQKTFSSRTEVEMMEMEANEIKYYIESYLPMDKAGAYGIQEWIGWAKIKRIEGSYSNIMGLPTDLVYKAIQGLL